MLIDPTARPQIGLARKSRAKPPDDDEVAKRTKTGPTRDIENEQATFDLGAQGGDGSSASADARQGAVEEQSRVASPLGPMGWGGGAVRCWDLVDWAREARSWDGVELRQLGFKR